MIALRLDALAEIVGGELVDPACGHHLVNSVTIDSRTARPGSLFVALPGERADGHDFLAHALRAGATGQLTRAGHPNGALGSAVVVDDPADALLGLGAWLRDVVDPTVVAVTGSNGKTTTKDFIAAAVGVGRLVVANAGSYNNELGVPLTCCRLEVDTEVLVAEIGARGVGHIARLAPVVAPDIAVVTTVAAAHLELLGSIELVATAKTELVEALTEEGLAVLNVDDPRVAAMAERAPGRVVTYGTSADADWRATDVELDRLARPAFRVRGVEVRLPRPGEHNVGNALAALAVADACGVAPSQAATGLARAAVSRWRMEMTESPSGPTVVNDAYNANPASMAAALRTLARMRPQEGGRRWAVLGHMAELGPGSADEHTRVGRLAAQLGIDALVLVGPDAAAIGHGAAAASAYHPDDMLRVADTEAAVSVLRRRLRAGDVVLVKASRSAGLERVAHALAREGGAASAAGGWESSQDEAGVASAAGGWRSGPGDGA
jgi:UDP-N-acetylmuramoyl-tripeptide--D-alanyl-D-alanine ligase